MTSGKFEREPKELPDDQFSVDDISPDVFDKLKHTPIVLDVGLIWGDNLAYGDDSLPGDDEEFDAEAGTIYITLGTPGNYSFVELTTNEEMGEALEQTPRIGLTGRPYIVADGVTPSDVTEMLSKVLRHEANDGTSS